MKLRLLPAFLFLFHFHEAFSQNKLTNSTTSGPRIYQTHRIPFTERPVIDGKLNDACWKTLSWSGNYTQWIPNEGAQPSQPTQLKILYDDKNIYVAIRAIDHEPEKIIRKAGRRDEFIGDMVGICFDSYHDRRTGFEFDVSAAGQKTDLLITNPANADNNWNAVWYVKTSNEDSAWTAEFRIPLSQLRYSKDSLQVWGLHSWRWIDRLQQESDWEPQSSKGPGMLYLFGELHGIHGLPRSRRFEMLPYTVGKLNTFKTEEANPFANKGRRWLGKAGLDAKIGLTSNLTVDLTVNPDFGQVESDPSVMNISAFETFYEEKRPFFLEGRNIFNFDFDNSSLFYSRRIGHVASFYPTLNDNEFIKYPDNTTILGAAKMSGKTAGGFSIGVLQSLTANEYASIDSLGKRKRAIVEPLTNYALVRVQQDYKQGNTVLGGIFTSTNRFIKIPALNFMNRNAYTGGIDLLHQWHDKEYYVEAKLVGSHISGNSEAMIGLQQSSARYYQRPDASHLHYDSTAGMLSGSGGSIKIGKGSKGLLRYSTECTWRSPGFDLNDMGYMQMADVIKQKNSAYYFVNKPVSIFRTYNATLSETNNWDFGLRYLSSSVNLGIYLEFLNKWAFNVSTGYTPQSLDTRILRGGSAMLVPSLLNQSVYMRTDPSRRLFFELNSELNLSGHNSARYYSIQPGIKYVPVSTLKLSASFNYSNSRNDLQYITTATSGSAVRYVLGKIEQRTMAVTLRVDYNITPEVSVQYYGSPFATVGKYSDFKRVSDPRARKYYNRFVQLNPTLNGSSYEVLENGNASDKFEFMNPDFDFGQFRSNLVFRWEYRAGSQVNFVWSQDRTTYVQPGGLSLSNGISSLGDVFPNNIFLIKFNYWFSI
ncbi:hypothetical protein GGD38_001545 [Chitinophagaceae bacterium OAS944]|uniref:DUF5916 domain-containing protein n=1 Tax=Niastella sp. OAS944 TaxID=2664089 RepID=UPI0035C7CFF8|nr:hypothetical protein [Chitinophagaceae bacterium OAS944]